MIRRNATTFADVLQSFAHELPRLRGREAGMLISRLRAMAIDEGMTPVAELADGLAAAMMSDRDGTPISSWIEAIRLAATMTAADRAAGQLLLATVGVRLAH